jgi:hypothetical protein
LGTQSHSKAIFIGAIRPSFLSWNKSRHHPVAQGLRVEGVDIDLGAALESGRGRDPPLDQHPPRHGHIHIGRLVIPFLIAGNVGTGGGVAGVNQIGHAAQFLRRVVPGLAAFALGEDLQRRIAMAKAGIGDGVIIFGHHQVAVGGEVDGGLVVKVGVGPNPLQFHLVLDPALVNRHQLLVQVVEGRAVRFSQFWKTAT